MPEISFSTTSRKSVREVYRSNESRALNVHALCMNASLAHSTRSNSSPRTTVGAHIFASQTADTAAPGPARSAAENGSHFSRHSPRGGAHRKVAPARGWSRGADRWLRDQLWTGLAVRRVLQGISGRIAVGEPPREEVQDLGLPRRLFIAD